MRVLLAAMPDTISALDPILRIPNLGLCSIAANLPGAEVRVVDLAFKRRRIDAFLASVLEEFRPGLVGLSAMSFQFASACHVARLVKELAPSTLMALGGYHATLMAEEIGRGPDAALFDFIVRGEGERTFASLVRGIDSGVRDFSGIPGLSFRSAGGFVHNPRAPAVDLDLLALPDRECRILNTPRFMGLRFDCVETSRGCSMGCKFCSITCMYGRTIKTFGLDRVLRDLHNLRAGGTEGVFFVDDNITLDAGRLKALCRAIVAGKLNAMSYVTQASVVGINADAELADAMLEAGFRWVFLGIESGIERNLRALGKPGAGRGAAAAVRSLRDRGICVFGGFIVGNPGDSPADIKATFRYALDLGVDHAIVQCLTPYPGTESRAELLASGLVTNPDDFSRYNGFISNVRTRHMETRELTSRIVRHGIRYYLDPRTVARSRLWRRHRSLIPALLLNNLRFVTDGLRNKLFHSRHTW